MHRTKYGPGYRLHRPDESLQHGQQRGPLGDSVQAGVPDQVREPDSPVPRHDRTGQVLLDGEASEPFSISNGVKQGYMLALVLFNLFFTCVLLEQGVYLRYRLDGSLFDLRRLTTKTKTEKGCPGSTVCRRQCPHGAAHRESDLKIIVNKFAEVSRLFGLIISLGKTEVLFQPAPAAAAHRPTI